MITKPRAIYPSARLPGLRWDIHVTFPAVDHSAEEVFQQTPYQKGIAQALQGRLSAIKTRHLLPPSSECHSSYTDDHCNTTHETKLERDKLDHPMVQGICANSITMTTIGEEMPEE